MSNPVPFGGPGGPPAGWPAGAPGGPSAGARATMAQMTEQLQTVIDAAERAAEAIRLDAEEQARRHLEEAQRRADRLTAERIALISELTDDLIRHATTVRQHSEGMVRALQSAMESVAGRLEVQMPAAPPPAGQPPAAGQPQGLDPLPALAERPAGPRPEWAAQPSSTSRDASR